MTATALNVVSDETVAVPVAKAKRSTRTRRPRNVVKAEPVAVPVFGAVAEEVAPAHKVMSVVDQLRMAWQPQNRAALLAGIPFGGLIPVAVFFVGHFEVDPNVVLDSELAILVRLKMAALILGVVGGLVVSAKTVYKWALGGFIDAETGKSDAQKALGLVILLETLMTLTSLMPLAVVMLTFLVVINSLAAGCGFALSAKQAKAKK
ncbi:hypothetical protein [Myxococcus phage Mx1]|nr:hypothetical protein [Myxococcus phage Mx1]